MDISLSSSVVACPQKDWETKITEHVDRLIERLKRGNIKGGYQFIEFSQQDFYQMNKNTKSSELLDEFIADPFYKRGLVSIQPDIDSVGFTIKSGSSRNSRFIASTTESHVHEILLHACRLNIFIGKLIVL